MAGETYTPNMNLVLPAPSTTQGPQWATDINSSLNIIDGHNHSAGEGVQISPSGLLINSDLPFLDNNATQLRSTRFTPQGTALSGASDLGCLYEAGVDLYYNDGVGNQIRITSGGSVTGASGTITGLPSGTASASFSAGTFIFQAATNTAANIDGGSYIFRNATASANGVTLAAPLALVGNYDLTLPLIPANQSFLTIDTSGNIAAYANVSGGISKSNIVAVGQQISASSTTFSTSSTSFVAATNQGVNITTTGKPVMIMLQGDGSSGHTSYIGYSTSETNTSAGIFLQLQRDGTAICNYDFVHLLPSSVMNAYMPSSGFAFLDTPSAGNHTYALYVRVDNASTGGFISYSNLVAYELT